MNTDTTHDELRDIIVATEPERKVLINAFLTRRKAMFMRHGAQLCSHFRQNRNAMLDDLAQIVSMSAYELILEICAKPKLLDEIVSFDAVVKKRASNATYQFVRSNAVTPLSGMGNVERRRALIAKTRKIMTENTGVVPTDDEVIAETNRRLWETNKDPKRSGFLVSRADLKSNIAVSSIIEEVDRPDTTDMHQPDRTGALGLHAGERPRFFKLVRDRLAFHDDARIGDVAEYWLRCGLEGEIPTGKDLAEEFNIDVTIARAHLRDIRAAAAAVLQGMQEDVDA